MDLSGVWEGHYFWNDLLGDSAPDSEGYAIRVEITEQDGQLTGQIRDFTTHYEFGVKEAFDLHKKQMSLEEVEEWTEWGNENPTAVLHFDVPARSLINGTHDGEDIYFMKVCTSSIKSAWKVESEEFEEEEFDPIPIRHVGFVSEDGKAINGKYFFTKTEGESRAWTRNGLFRITRTREE